MKIQKPLLPLADRPLSSFLTALALCAGTLHQADAGPKGPDKGQFEIRFFAVTVTETLDGEPSPYPIFWPVASDDSPVRIGRLEDGTNPTILINSRVCGGYDDGDGCLPAEMIPAHLNDDPDGTNPDPTCFPGDDPGTGVHGANAGFSADGLSFNLSFYGLSTTGRTLWYRFQAVSEPLGGFAGFLALSSPGMSAQFKLKTWILQPAEGPGGGKNACTGAGDFVASGREVILTVTRIARKPAP